MALHLYFLQGGSSLSLEDGWHHRRVFKDRGNRGATNGRWTGQAVNHARTDGRTDERIHFPQVPELTAT